MVSLYDLTSQQRQLLEMDIETAEDGQAMADLLNELADDIETKATRIGYVISQLGAEVGALKAEEERLHNRRKVRENKVERLKQYLLENMTKTGIRKAGDVNITVSIQKSAPSVYVRDISLLPRRYLVEQPPKVDKKAIQHALYGGETVPGVAWSQGEHVRIK
jgi:hypothetical protein